MDLENILGNVVAFINEVRGESRQPVYQRIADEIMEEYARYYKKGLLQELKKTLSDDPELLSLVLFTLQFITKDPECIRVLEELLLEDLLDVYTKLEILFQISVISFRENIPVSYQKTREIHDKIWEAAKQDFTGLPDYLPLGQRNLKRIVLSTDLLLGELHAPSRIVYEMAELLTESGYEVMIVVNIEQEEYNRKLQYCFAPFDKNSNGFFGKNQMVEYHGKKYQAHQFYYSRSALQEQRELMELIHDFRPFCVFSIGGTSPVQDIYQKLTTQLFMGCTDGYPCSSAPVLVSYMNSGSKEVQEAMAYAEARGQKLCSITWGLEFERENLNLGRSDLGILPDRFALCVVGNRLDDEISAEFREMLFELTRQHSQVHIVLIGDCREDVLGNIPRTRYTLLGFRKDLMDVMSLMDLFVNPPRKGGGGGAVRALAMGVPVVTLPYCDVSNVSGEAFCCQDLTEMKEQIERYLCDKDFYRSMQEAAREAYERRKENAGRKKESVVALLEQVREWLRNGELA